MNSVKFGFFESQSIGPPKDKLEDNLYKTAVWHPLPDNVDAFITGKSWRDFGPVKSEFAYVQFTHWNMKNEVVTGELIICKELACEVMEIAHDIFKASFPIEQSRLIDYWNADDEASMSDNNSSALCVRQITGGGNLSNHALGRAWDINTRLNPYHNPGKNLIAPKNGEVYLDRTQNIHGMIKEGDVVVQAFKSRGWEWGGNWKDRVDYQHFQKPKTS